MFRNARILGVIPARGGSKGIPRKNIQLLAGRPLLAHTIRQAAAVPELDLTVVSTDDEEITAMAREYDMRVVRRPDNLATDSAPTEWALIHALDHLAQTGAGDFDYIVVLEPTSPLRRPETISACIQKLVSSSAVSLLTVVGTKKNIGRIEDGFFRPMIPGQPRRRQDRRPLFVESSTVYVSRVDHLRETGWLVAEDWMAFEVNETEATDINEMTDFMVAESLMKQGEEI